MNKIKLLGVDIGGSHISAAIIDQENGGIVSSSLINKSVDSNGSAETILNTWGSVLEEICSSFSKAEIRIGVAMPGPFDYENGVSLIKNMNKYDSIYKVSVREYLVKLLGVGPKNIIFRNDAESFLHGEVMYGAAKGFKKAIGITIGTGLGSAISDNMVTRDVNLGSSLFMDGIAEDYISTRWFVKRYYERTGAKIVGVKELMELCDLKVVQEIFEEFSNNLFVFLRNFIEMEKPEVVIIGGNITKSYKMFWESLVLKIRENCPNVVVRRTDLWENAALMGVAGCWSDDTIFSN